jgi:hypothetical protein
MKVSNFADVGQMRRSRGISMKIMRKELALEGINRLDMFAFGVSRLNLQAESSEEDHDGDMEKM